MSRGYPGSSQSKVEVDKALYSAPHQLVGRHLKARRGSKTVEAYFPGNS